MEHNVSDELVILPAETREQYSERLKVWERADKREKDLARLSIKLNFIRELLSTVVTVVAIILVGVAMGEKLGFCILPLPWVVPTMLRLVKRLNKSDDK